MQINILLFWLIYWCMVHTSLAQTVLKEGKLYLHTNSQVTIKGKVLNKGIITNQGTLSVSGDWENTSSYISSAGTLALNGNNAQVFHHNNQPVAILTITNPTDIRLASDVTIQHTLILQQGIVTPEANTKLIIAEKAEVQGGATHAHINGAMYHTGPGNKFYPVGKNGQYAPVTLTQVSGKNPVVGIEFYDDGLPTPVEGSMQFQAFYWNLSALSGRFDGSPVSFELANPVWQEEDPFFILGNDNLAGRFKTLDKANVQMQENHFVFSSSIPIRSQYLSLGIQAYVKEPIYIPNSLSPFAPHAEDRAIKIYGNNIEATGFQWTIWDHWGHVVYTTSSYQQASSAGWQGTHKEKGEASPGIYKYALQATLTNGQPFSKTGNIVLYK